MFNHLKSNQFLDRQELYSDIRELPTNSSCGTYTITGEYIPPTKSKPNDSLASDLYLCSGSKIRRPDSESFVVLAEDTKLFYTANIIGNLGGAEILIVATNDKNSKPIETIYRDDNIKSFPTGFSSKVMEYQNTEIPHKKETNSNNNLAKNKLYISDAKIILNGFNVQQTGIQEIILDQGTKLRSVGTSLSIKDAESKYVSIRPDNFVFEFAKTEDVVEKPAETDIVKCLINVLKQFENNNKVLTPQKYAEFPYPLEGVCEIIPDIKIKSKDLRDIKSQFESETKTKPQVFKSVIENPPTVYHSQSQSQPNKQTNNIPQVVALIKKIQSQPENNKQTNTDISSSINEIKTEGKPEGTQINSTNTTNTNEYISDVDTDGELETGIKKSN